ncbi:MAG: acyltransferase [Clostridiales bacterium]|nr:acyltransferase [Clostridiales bacterium]
MTKVRFINIVRVVGLFLVLTYHLFSNYLPGGFFGVDIFFTFSGYLITSIIILTFENKGNFKFLPYIERRFLRIFPSLFFSIMFTLPFFKFISPDFSVGIDKQITGALGFVTNYYEILTGGSYEAQLIPHLYVHTWSLALELHYYLLWGLFAGLVIYAISKSKGSKENKVNLLKILLTVSSILIAIASYVNMQFLFSKDYSQSFLYFATNTHIYPFFIGSAIATFFGIQISPELSQSIKAKAKGIKAFSIITFIISLGVIIALCIKFKFEDAFTYRFGFLIISVLASLLILSARLLHEAINPERKDLRIINYLADLSYSIYLFHWPFYIVFSNIFNSNYLAAGLTLIASFAFSNFVLYVIEPLFYKRSYSDETKEKSSNVRKYVSIAVVAVLSISCMVINTNIFLNKLDVSALEEEQMVGAAVQSIDKIDSVKTGLDKISETAFAQKDGIPDFDKLETTVTKKQTKETTVTPTVAPEVTIKKVVNPDASNRNVTIIGDSVAMGARKSLQQAIPNCYVDAQGSRNLMDGYSILAGLKKSDSLGNVIVVALGTNGCDPWKEYIDKIIADFSPDHKVIFVTPYDGHWGPRWWSYRTTEYLRSLNGKYPNVKIADWAARISQRPELLGSDKIHIGGNQTAINMFVNTIVEQL